ncbi:MAG: hypothetical protein WD226_06140 [Planctomycetota bacterium]
MKLTTLTTLAFAGAATLFTACFSSSDPDTIAPGIASATQNQDVDPLGLTVDLLLSERVTPDSANEPATWTVTGAGHIVSATLQPDAKTVRLVTDVASIPGDVTFGAVAQAAATGSVELTAQATDGDTVTVSDGTTVRVFEFTSGGGATGTNVEVDKGADAAAAIAAFIAAVNAESFDVTASAGVGDQAVLTQDEAGIGGNVLLTESDAGNAITLVGMAGGAGLEDLAGNSPAAAITGIALVSTDTVEPIMEGVAGVTVSGANNDEIRVTFDDDMIASEVEDPANWVIEAPIGTGFSPTGANIEYDVATRGATMTLVDGVPGIAGDDANNLQTRDTLQVAFTNVRDLGGNALGLTALSGVSLGDSTPPVLENVASNGVADTALVRFSESMKQVAFADLYTGGIDAGARFQLNDKDSTPGSAATGLISFSGIPLDGETFTLTDAQGTSETFEYDNDSTVEPGNLAVTIAIDPDEQALFTLQAIDSSALEISTNWPIQAVSLEQQADGTAGNVTIVGNVTNVTFDGMSGGVDAVAADATLEAAGFAWSAEGASLTVDYDVVPANGVDTFSFYGVEDLAGNQAIPMSDVVLSTLQTSTPTFDVGNSLLTAIAGAANDEITVIFAEPMSAAHITNPANYAALPLDLSTADVSFDGTSTVTLRLNGVGPAYDVQFGTNYDLEIIDNAATPIATLSGVELAGDVLEVVVGSGDNTPIAAATAIVGPASLPNTAIVEFEEAPNIAAALTAANYALEGVTSPTEVEQLSSRSFLLTFAAQPTDAETLDITVAAATDLSGNVAGGLITVAVGSVDATAPTATFSAAAVENAGNDTLAIVFDETVDVELATLAANYAITSGGSSVDLTGATLDYDGENATVTITLAAGIELAFGDAISMVISNVTDLSGNVLAVQPVDAVVAGDNVEPDFAGADSAFVNYIADATGLTVDVMFSEDVDATFAGTLGNWSTSGATVLQSVEVLSPRLVRFTTDVQIGAAETIDVTGLVDLAGNVNGAAANVDPHE